MLFKYNSDKNYTNFLNSVSDSKFTPIGKKVPDKNKPVFTPNSPKSTSTKGDFYYSFYKDYYYDRKTGFEWQRKY